MRGNAPSLFNRPFRGRKDLTRIAIRLHMHENTHHVLRAQFVLFGQLTEAARG